MTELTDTAVEALADLAARLQEREEYMSPTELRTYMWARSSLAVVAGIRAEAACADL